ncbi:hypothetical protein HUS23_05985 [Ectothiorhodospiraceae bacterium 2226]|nr:hypothetical protein HUS23_05985 [Ectothiorhodospiraceae bacterium 2226]
MVVDEQALVPDGWLVEQQTVGRGKKSIIHIAAKNHVCAKLAENTSHTGHARAGERTTGKSPGDEPLHPLLTRCAGANLPPDPGPAGKATLVGIDSDGSGVRDDVQRYILLEHTDKLELIPPLMLHAATIQEAFQAFELGDPPPAGYVEIVTANVRCVAYLSSDGVERLLRLTDLIMNTPQRWAAKLSVDKQAVGGTSIPVRGNGVSDCSHI